MTQEALKLALAALEANDQLINGTGTNGGLAYCIDGYYSDCFDVDPINKQTEEAIAAIKEALAQIEQEPVACIYKGYLYMAHEFQSGQVPVDSQPLYTTPPQRTWVGLNKEEAFELQKKYEGKPSSLSAAVENLLREKNHG